MRKAYARTTFGQIRYLEMGKGEPLILLHETPRSASLFAEVMPYYAEHFRVIAIDTPGYGYSDRPAGEPGIEGYARAVVEFMDAIQIPRASLFGRRTGASIAVQVAATSPDRVIKLVLDGCPDYDPDVRKKWLARDVPILAIDGEGSHLPKAWAASDKDRRGYVSLELINLCAIDNLVSAGFPNYGHKAVFEQDLRSLLPQIEAPTLLFSGDGDDFIERQPGLLAVLKNGRPAILENCKRFPSEENPAGTSEIVSAFLLEK